MSVDPRIDYLTYLAIRLISSLLYIEVDKDDVSDE